MKLKYKILMGIIVISIGLCLMLYRSYALWVVTLSGQENIVSVGCFNIEFLENSSSIALNNSYPVSDQKGMSGSAYSFTVTNKCTVDSSYQVTLNTLNKNTMGDDKVKYAIYKEGTTKPSTGSLVNSASINTDTANLNVADLKTSYIIASGELRGAEEENGTGESHTYNVYLWIDENAGNEVENTKFEASINIVNASVKLETTATATILNLAQSHPEELAYDGTSDNNLRYIGASPNNYVLFNEELWRIIGVFNNIDDGTGTKETRLKIMKEEPYKTEIMWNESDINDWSQAPLQKELNESYLSTIKSPYNSMISNAVWNLGGTKTYEDVTASMFYESERGTEVYEGRPTEWIGKIGLMYPSDYGFATGGETIENRTMCLEEFLYNWQGSSNSICFTNNWIYDENLNQWTMTPRTTYPDNVFAIRTEGYVTNRRTSYDLSASPVLYLDSSVIINGGEGTNSNPYTLKN